MASKISLRLILFFPLSLMWDLIIRVRNLGFESRVLKSQKGKINSIIIGNIAIGGTGKTPHCLYVIDLLKDKYKISFLSRGYKRKTKGFIEADDKSDTHQIGDEPLLIYQRLNSQIPVFVGENRVKAIEKIYDTNHNLEWVILDDAFQHRTLKGTFYIMLSSFENLFFNDYLLPAGSLREHRFGVKRANAIVISKTPDSIHKKEIEQITSKIRKYALQNTTIFFSKIVYQEPIDVFGNDSFFENTPIISFSGLANDTNFENYLKQNFNLQKHFAFPDHHDYTILEIKEIILEAQKMNCKFILTTEKDKVKLFKPEFSDLFQTVSLFYIPIGISFLKEYGDFDVWLKKEIELK